MHAECAFHAPMQLDDAARLLRETEHARPLAGGQSLIAAMKLGLATPQHLVALQATELRDRAMSVDERRSKLKLGAMVTHAAIAKAELIQNFCPMLSSLAGGIGDQQVRNMGTIGGSLANNDPAACWPCGALALGAQIETTQRVIAADDFFDGVYQTVLRRDEIIVGITFPRPDAAHYIKFEQKASRFALVGVAVARFGGNVRVAVTGLGNGVIRWRAAEVALTHSFTQTTMQSVTLGADAATSDLHASAAYRAHLAQVLTRRCVQAILGETARLIVSTPTSQLVAYGGNAPSQTPNLVGEHVLDASVEKVWAALLSPAVLRRCIPGCEAFDLVGENTYAAKVKLGLGPIFALFQTRVELSNLQPPNGCTLTFAGEAGALGGGTGVAQVTLHPVDSARTRVCWRAKVSPSGKIAQLGARLLQASAHRVAREFFAAFARQADATSALSMRPWWWQRLLNWMKRT